MSVPALAVCRAGSLDGPPPGLPAGISARSGNGMTGNGGPCVDTRRRVRACLLGRRVPNEYVRLTPAEKTSLSGRGPGCIDVSASAAVEDAEDQRHAVTYLSDGGDGAAALHGARRSPQRPFG